LADLEKTKEKDFEPFFDRNQIILEPFVRREQIRPIPAVFIAPRMAGQESYFARLESVPRDEIKIEILQLVGADFLGGFLGRFREIAIRMRHQLR